MDAQVEQDIRRCLAGEITPAQLRELLPASNGDLRLTDGAGIVYEYQWRSREDGQPAGPPASGPFHYLGRVELRSGSRDEEAA